MSVTLIMLVLFILAIYGGVRRGLIIQLFSLLGYTVAFWAAMIFHKSLSNTFELVIPYPSASFSDSFFFYSEEVAFRLDEAFYDIISFLVILFFISLIVRVILYIIKPLGEGDTLNVIDEIGGGIVSFLLVYINLFFIIFLLTTIPIPFIQNLLSNSNLAQWMIEKTPLLSDLFYQEWIMPLM